MYRIVLESPFSKKKIVSYGLIVIARTTGRMIAVQRRHSVEFLTIIAGSFRSGALPFLLSKITGKESQQLRTLLTVGKNYFQQLYRRLNLFPSDLSMEYAWTTWCNNRDRMVLYLDNLIFTNELTWLWPKGRVSNEFPFECALREFKEEVDVVLPLPLHKSDRWLTVTLNTIDHREIECRYWIYMIEDEMNLPVANNHPEVEDRCWMSLHECRERMRVVIPSELETFVKKIM